jgi:hypothetical protein
MGGSAPWYQYNSFLLGGDVIIRVIKVEASGVSTYLEVDCSQAEGKKKARLRDPESAL